jgi:hypothetical protein
VIRDSSQQSGCIQHDTFSQLFTADKLATPPQAVRHFKPETLSTQRFWSALPSALPLSNQSNKSPKVIPAAAGLQICMT